MIDKQQKHENKYANETIMPKGRSLNINWRHRTIETSINEGYIPINDTNEPITTTTVLPPTLKNGMTMIVINWSRQEMTAVTSSSVDRTGTNSRLNDTPTLQHSEAICSKRTTNDKRRNVSTLSLDWNNRGITSKNTTKANSIIQKWPSLPPGYTNVNNNGFTHYVSNKDEDYYEHSVTYYRREKQHTKAVTPMSNNNVNKNKHIKKTKRRNNAGSNASNTSDNAITSKAVKTHQNRTSTELESTSTTAIPRLQVPKRHKSKRRTSCTSTADPCKEVLKDRREHLKCTGTMGTVCTIEHEINGSNPYIEKNVKRQSTGIRKSMIDNSLTDTSSRTVKLYRDNTNNAHSTANEKSKEHKLHTADSKQLDSEANSTQREDTTAPGAHSSQYTTKHNGQPSDGRSTNAFIEDTKSVDNCDQPDKDRTKNSTVMDHDSTVRKERAILPKDWYMQQYCDVVILWAENLRDEDASTVTTCNSTAGSDTTNTSEPSNDMYRWQSDGVQSARNIENSNQISSMNQLDDSLTGPAVQNIKQYLYNNTCSLHAIPTKNTRCHDIALHDKAITIARNDMKRNTVLHVPTARQYNERYNNNDPSNNNIKDIKDDNIYEVPLPIGSTNTVSSLSKPYSSAYFIQQGEKVPREIEQKKTKSKKSKGKRVSARSNEDRGLTSTDMNATTKGLATVEQEPEASMTPHTQKQTQEIVDNTEMESVEELEKEEKIEETEENKDSDINATAENLVALLDKTKEKEGSNKEEESEDESYDSDDEENSEFTDDEYKYEDYSDEEEEEDYAKKTVGVWATHEDLVFNHKVKCFPMKWMNEGQPIMTEHEYDERRPTPITINIVPRRRNNNQRMTYDYARVLYSMLVAFQTVDASTRLIPWKYLHNGTANTRNVIKEASDLTEENISNFLEDPTEDANRGSFCARICIRSFDTLDAMKKNAAFQNWLRSESIYLNENYLSTVTTSTVGFITGWVAKTEHLNLQTHRISEELEEVQKKNGLRKIPKFLLEVRWIKPTYQDRCRVVMVQCAKDDLHTLIDVIKLRPTTTEFKFHRWDMYTSLSIPQQRALVHDQQWFNNNHFSLIIRGIRTKTRYITMNEKAPDQMSDEDKAINKDKTIKQYIETNYVTGDKQPLFCKVFKATSGKIEVVTSPNKMAEAERCIEQIHQDMAHNMSEWAITESFRYPAKVRLNLMNHMPWTPFDLSSYREAEEESEVQNTGWKRHRFPEAAKNATTSAFKTYSSAAMGTSKVGAYHNSQQAQSNNKSQSVYDNSAVNNHIKALQAQSTMLSNKLEKLEKKVTATTVENKEAMQSLTNTVSRTEEALNEVIDNTIPRMQWELTDKVNVLHNKVDLGFATLSTTLDWIKNEMELKKVSSMEPSGNQNTRTSNDNSLHHNTLTGVLMNVTNFPTKRKSTLEKDSPNKLQPQTISPTENDQMIAEEDDIDL
jgi:hypothetical protein